MYIEGQLYQYHLSKINEIRFILFKTLYPDMNCIEELKQCIANNIETLSIDFDPSDFSFTVKIKKTAMRRIKGFNHSPIFYYSLINNVFVQFINENKERIRAQYPNIGELTTETSLFHYLATISCFDDNIVIVKL